MAGMFYSLQEAAERLGKKEEEIQEIVKQGRLREFRDGPNLLFKVDEVEALMSDTSIMGLSGASAEEQMPVDEDEILLVPEAAEESPAGEEELVEEDTVVGGEGPAGEEELAEEGTVVAGEGPAGQEEPAEEGTVVGGEGINVLEETDSDFQLADDTQGETKSASGLGDVSLEEIEEDVNLDTFGSGSGLLDLSLQADDTSLGGILDEIYTAENGEGQAEVAEEEGTAMDVVVEAEEIMPEEELAEPVPVEEAAVVVAGYIEPEPDTASNVLGMMLFLPFLVVIYTATVMLASFRGARPAILTSVQGIILPLLGGFLVVALAAAGMAVFSGGGKAAKKPKVEKVKEPKPKKEKKPKEKKPKKEKKKKEKKKKGKKE